MKVLSMLVVAALCSQLSAGQNCTSSVSQAERVKRNEIHRVSSLRVQDLPKNVKPLPLESHWYTGLAALPVTGSDVIAVGTVNSSGVFVARDSQAIYSDFVIKIGRILKGGSHKGECITAERSGGTVQFASGDWQHYSIRGQGLPKPGRIYLFFLKDTGSSDYFHLITAYDISNSKVAPLDDVAPFNTFSGADSSSLVDAAERAVAHRKGLQ